VILIGLVSIPSSSGPGFGPVVLLSIALVCISFNPLFIGAWVRTSVMGEAFPSLCHSFNPLFIGAWVRTDGKPFTICYETTFQSPLHRGLGSDRHLLEAMYVPPDGK